MTTRTGKIARLPAKVREEINRQLYDGASGVEIERALKRYGISQSNISQWRKGGYQDWLKTQTQMENIQKRAELAMRMAKAAGGSLASSIVTRIAGELDEKLDALGDEDLAKMKPILDTILMADKLQLDRRKVGQKDEEISLNREKFQRDTAALFLKWYADQKAREIADQPETGADEKVERLGQLMFGDDWK